MNEEEQRERFEVWAKPSLHLLRQPAKAYDMDYAYQATESAWRAWIEATRQASAQAVPAEQNYVTVIDTGKYG